MRSAKVHPTRRLVDLEPVLEPGPRIHPLLEGKDQMEKPHYRLTTEGYLWLIKPDGREYLAGYDLRSAWLRMLESRNLSGPVMSYPSVIIVAGLGRCGSSLTMQMLCAAGVPCVGRYPAFEEPWSSPLSFCPARFSSLSGHAVKILDPHLMPPLSGPRVAIFLTRNPREQAASMLKLVAAAFDRVPVDRRTRRAIEASIRRDAPLARRAVAGEDPFATLDLTFEDLIRNPLQTATEIASFLRLYGHDLDPIKMAAAVRSRDPACGSDLLELRLLS